MWNFCSDERDENSMFGWVAEDVLYLEPNVGNVLIPCENELNLRWLILLPFTKKNW